MKRLLVEEDPETSTYFKRAITEAGHTVDVAATGRDGLMLAAGEPYDAMLLNRMPPQLDGPPAMDGGLRGSEDERERLFDRLYRHGHRRSTPGSGPGVTLVTAVAKQNGAVASLHEAAPGLIARVTFHRGA